VKELPEKATVVRSVKARKPEHVYLDYLQNLYGKSIVAPYAIRERKGATVSMPVSWKEIEKGFDIGEFTLSTVRARLKRRKDLFKGAIEGGQSLPI
jgi:bifunctional non-homologous end joining protein LigD